ncbi:hypothetical protein ACHAXT_013083 [Thalassiosira profunda]
MKPIVRSATLAATPQTIWAACFESVSGWAAWDPDLAEVKDVSGGCDNGTTCTFIMNDGKTHHPVNKSLDFTGSAFGGTIRAEGKIRIAPIDDLTSKIDYSFAMSGLLGGMVGLFKMKECVLGTEGGLENMKKLSEEAQRAK